MWEYLSLLFSLAIVSFVQNMAFTWTSRSRNSGDPAYHRYAAWSSNGIWFICQLFVFKIIWKPLLDGEWLFVGLGGLVYIAATTEGSVLMMKLLLGHISIPILNKLKEKDKRQVGAK